MTFSKYILQFTKNTEKHQTHLSFNNGKYNVPDNKFDEFYNEYYKVISDKNNTSDLYLIEKVTDSKFAFFIDLDVPKKYNYNLTDDDVSEVIQTTKTTIKDHFIDDPTLTECIVSKRITQNGSNYHINFYNLIVNNQLGNNLISKIKKTSDLQNCIDISVYRTGLRLLGSKKLDKTENNFYKIYDINSHQFTELHETTLEDFKKTIVKRKSTINLTQLKNSITKEQLQDNQINKNDQLNKNINSKIQNELVHLLQNLKLTNTPLQNFDLAIQKIYAKQNTMGIFCYYISINHKHCPFKDRQHERQGSPIYLEININGVYIKCHDEECRRRTFPEKQIQLPNTFETDYPQIYLSMTTKYWRSEITLSDDIRTVLEESLSGSHYAIAKAVFQIYKNRFRVDDIKNTEWYEFGGVRWRRSHLMNILISEELPKYYRAIKISDTSVQTKNLQDFLVNTERIDANMRNGMVDNIIAKLENVSFKNNIISQIVYLFKTYDPDFYQSLDSTTYLVGFKNGVYDFKKDEFRVGHQNDYITFSTGYDFVDYDPDAKQTKEIYEFLEKIIPNKRVLEYTLKVLGKALIGIPDERFYIWTGLSGANGKSTLVNFLEYTLGDYITSVDVSLLTNKRANASNASPDVVRLRGKRIFTFQEPEHDDKLRTGILKQYTGGDTIIARELFKAPITFKLQGTMIMCCNDLPSVTSCDGGTWRRIRVIDFTSRFCENPVKTNEFKIDPTIKYKIQSWRPYFMSILIHWYKNFLTQGMNEPDEVTKATAKYKVDNDKFNEFFDQIIEESQTNFESTKTIYSHFSNWWSNNYPNSRIPDIKDFKRAMKTKYGNEHEKVVNGRINFGFNVTVYNIENEQNEDDL
jgi:P4 family phage/plasmid primase-like protien